MFSLAGRSAVITGATGGIGKAITEVLHAQGADILASGTSTERLQQFASQFSERMQFTVCRLDNVEEVEKLIDDAVELLSKVDILVCNAGITKDNLALRMKNSEFMDVINVNLFANFILNRAAVKHMLRNKYGRIVNIASVIGVSGNAGQANYAAAKAGLIGVTKSLAQEVAHKGITVNAVAPGFIATPMTDGLKEEHKNKVMEGIPAGRFGSTNDVAYAVAFLASEEASYINGQTIHVNGGMLMI